MHEDDSPRTWSHFNGFSKCACGPLWPFYFGGIVCPKIEPKLHGNDLGERERERESARRSREIIGVDRGAEGEEIWHSSKLNFFCVALSRQNLGLWINS